MRAFLKRKQRRILLLLVTIILCVLTRTLFLDTSARFVWDESGDLVRMHEIFKEKKITLIGPISQDKINVYGSLTYYMLLPFALIFQFDPIGPVIGAAFYSLVSLFLLAIILWKSFGWSLEWCLLFLSFIFPFLQAGRWAWNPNLVPFWQILSLLVYFSVFLKSKRGIWLFFSGFLQSLAVHNHWYAAFALAGFSVFVFLSSPRQKKWRYFLIFLTGVSVGLAPFLVFDLTHPPGLFITRMIYFSPLSLSQGAFSIKTFFLRSISLPYRFLFYFFQERLISWLMLILVLLFALKNKLVKNLLLLPLLFLFIGLSLIGGEVYQHYFLSGVVFLVIWLFHSKKNFHPFFQKLIILLFFIFSIKPSVTEIFKNNWSTNIAATREIVMNISRDIGSRSCNLVVVASPDPNTKGKRYRDLLFLKGISLLPDDNYRDNECLYVVSSRDEVTIRRDPAYELDRIRNTSATKEWQIKNSIWNVYRFDIK